MFYVCFCLFHNDIDLTQNQGQKDKIIRICRNEKQNSNVYFDIVVNDENVMDIKDNTSKSATAKQGKAVTIGMMLFVLKMYRAD